MKKNHELAGIEILRFVCAFGVIVWHYQQFFFTGGWDSGIAAGWRPKFPAYALLQWFYENGSLAVPFFWVISGFIFYWHYAESIRSTVVTLFDYVLRRFSRLYPLHLVTLILVALGQYVYFKFHGVTFIYSWNKPIWFVAQLFMASNWFRREPVTFNGPIWSVSVETLIYIIFYFVVRVFGNRAIVAALVAGGFALCLYSWHGFISSEVFECGMYFFTGGIAQRLYSRPTPISIGAAVIFTILAAWSYAWAGVNPVFLILLAVSVVIAITKVGETFFHKPFSRLAFLGNATYSSYLLHFPIQLFAVILVDYAGLTRSIFYSPVALIAYLSSVFGLSLAVHRYFEMPAQSLLRGMVRFAFSGTSDSGRRSPLKTELSDRPRA